MRRLLSFAAVLLATLSACGSKAPASPVGTWVVDAEKTLDAVVAAAKRHAPAEGAPMDDATLRARVAERTDDVKVEVQLRGDGTAHMTLEARFGNKVQDGVWEAKGDEVLLTATTSNGSPATGGDAKTQRFQRRDGGLVLRDDKGREMIWLRRL